MPHTVPDFIQALMVPDLYPHKVDEVTLIQTHISYVLIAGAYVYKIKKPVDFGFFDRGKSFQPPACRVAATI